MPRYSNYQVPQTRSQREREFWDDPANVLGLARDAAREVERAQEHEMDWMLRQQEMEAVQARHDERMGIESMKLQNAERDSAHAIGAYADLTDLDPAAPDYRKRVSSVIARYPRAVMNKDVTQLLEKQNKSHEAFIGSLRTSFGLPAEVDPTQYTRTDESTGATTFDFDMLDEVGKRAAISKSKETAEILGERMRALQEQNIAPGATRATLTDKGTTVQMGGADEDEKRKNALLRDQFKAAEARRNKALGLRFPRGLQPKDQQEAAQKELEDADREYSLAYKSFFGTDWKPHSEQDAAAPAAQPKAEPKPLDRDTAMKFLKQAGGNKDEARRLAREAGFSF